MEIHTNSNGLSSHHNSTQAGCDVNSSVFDLRQTFANFLHSLGGKIESTNKETDAVRNYGRAEVRFG
jgi:hypothetical protein